METEESSRNNSRYPISKKTIVFGIVPFIVIGAMLILLLSSPGILFQSPMEPLPQISIEKVEFSDQYIVAFIRNTGPSEITIAQADVNDRIHPAAIEPGQTLSKFADAKVIIPFIWNPGEPYNIGITTDDGTRFEKTIDSAAQVPRPTIEQASSFALIGTYVGVIPVMMGLVWYPFIRRLSIGKYNFFLSLTAGLLVFLGIDALLESNEIAIDNLAPAFNSQILIIIVAIVSFLALQYVSQKLVQRASKSKSDVGYSSEITSRSTPDLQQKDVRSSSGTSLQQQLLIRPLAISMMISIGIGLHNFGEGLAIGAAVLLGEIALSSFLILGFTLHNTTEGLAIVAPMAKTRRIPIRKLIIMGLIAGVPTILGAWIGGFLYSPVATVIFLSIGAGAIFQVVYSIGSWMHHTSGSKALLGNFSIIIGFALGMLLMYLTGLLI
ncbi:MAG TPA: divalent cation transporter [Nitrososphaeraceae archaeon]|jgi:zinc transporter ZupT|nr:divalent cation transporter [Nitrososphaeraceae archaeon]